MIKFLANLFRGPSYIGLTISSRNWDIVALVLANDFGVFEVQLPPSAASTIQQCIQNNELHRWGRGVQTHNLSAEEARATLKNAGKHNSGT